MLKQCCVLIAAALLISCAPKVQPPSASASTSKPSDLISNEEQNTVVAVSVPMSPLDPEIADGELAALTDVWQRIRHQSHIQVPRRADIQREISFFSNKQKFFNEVANRAEPYLYMIVTELEKRRMPVEIALLPIVESAFNPAAQGKGPAGLWQMVPQTARNFGLKIQHGYDGRKDPMSSTIAVLDYLQHLHDSLGNDWLNAVAAYNTGEGRIMAAIERNKARGKPIDYWSLQIPGRFVQTMPKWLAMISMVKNPSAYQIKLPRIANKPAVAATQIKGAVKLQQAADLAGIPLLELKKLNPGFSLTTTPDGREFPLLLPLHALNSFEQQRHQLKRVAVAAQPVNQQRYAVKNGDTLGSIAKRFNTNVPTLRRLNHLKSDQLKLGQSLVLPGAKNNSGRVANRESQTYQVKKGDSLWTIAQKLRIDSEELRIYNKLPSNTHLQPGQKLRIPASSSKPKNSAARESTKPLIYTVKKGDSLERIARQQKIKLADLLKWNKLQADSTIKLGQQLRLTR